MTSYHIKKDNQVIIVDTDNYLDGIAKLIDAGIQLMALDYDGSSVTVFKMDGYCFRHEKLGMAHCSTVRLAATLFIYWTDKLSLDTFLHYLATLEKI